LKGSKGGGGNEPKVHLYGWVKHPNLGEWGWGIEMVFLGQGGRGGGGGVF